jgi:hypothetical protein
VREVEVAWRRRAARGGEKWKEGRKMETAGEPSRVAGSGRVGRGLVGLGPRVSGGGWLRIRAEPNVLVLSSAVRLRFFLAY